MFILHGSSPWHDWSGFQFYRRIGEVFEYDPHRPINALLIGFSLGVDDLPSKSDERIITPERSYELAAHALWISLKLFNPHLSWVVRAASRDADEFRRQVKHADLLYVPGGDTPTLVNAVNRLMFDFNRYAREKVCAGGSAGASCWGAFYYSNDYRKVLPGLGTLEAKIMSHYSSDKFPQLNTLIQTEPKDFPVITIADGEFVTLNPKNPNTFKDLGNLELSSHGTRA